ncbi:hypothetical protein DPMN_006742 [Dreissena polymorpha]|uniref:Fucolectin tachylectin-4 pentraxin-1 domain-containing protein n=1 Tax=Dreissena polymorpha TaxID=45954 RepID=A0A9D4RY17_DREPO|nr:hypothetical protein DPMN_006742 [Dreissena polymorpha]
MCTIGCRQRCIRHKYFKDHANHVQIDICAAVTSAAVNVALGKPAYQTDTYANFTADRAVDGNTSSDPMVKSCTHTRSNNTSWWVNLQQIFRIRSVNIVNRNDSKERGFQSLEGFRQGEVGLSYTFELAAPVYGQWVRITRNPPYENLTLCEVEVDGIPYSAVNGLHFTVFQGYIHTGTAIDVSKKVGSQLVCASRCSISNNCISILYNAATLTCSLFDSLAFKTGDVENDVCVVNSIAITNNSRAQLFGT